MALNINDLIPPWCRKYLENESLLLILVISAVFLWTLPAFNISAAGGLDPSWKIGTEQAFLDRMQFGIDVVFPHGPLDFLEEPVMISYPLWALSVLFNLAKYLVFFVSLYMLFRQLSAKWYVFAVAVPALVYVSVMTDSLILITFTVFSFTVFLKDHMTRADWAISAIIAVMIAASSLIKFNVLLVGIATICLVFALFFLSKKKLQYPAAFLTCYLGLVVVFWALSGQSLANVGEYLRTGFELSLGYNTAMLVPMLFQNEVALAVAALALAALLAYSLLQRDRNLLIFILFNAIIILSDYKHAVVRQEYVFQTTALLLVSLCLVFILSGLKRHDALLLGLSGFVIVAFFKVAPLGRDPVIIGLIALAIFALAAVLLARKLDLKATGLPRSVMIGLSVAAMLLLVIVLSHSLHDVSLDLAPKLPSYVETAGYLASPGQFDTAVDQQKRLIRGVDQIGSDMTGVIGGRTVDIVPWDIALCWAYGMNWTPRPVFQSYSAYTQNLDRLNSGFYESDRAPQYVLYAFKSIDGRYPLFDEPATFRELLLNYTLAGRSGDFLLLNRTDGSASLDEVNLGTAVAKMGQEVAVPQYDGRVFGYLQYSPSLPGSIKSLAFAPSPMYIRFRLSDGTETGNYRFIPDTAKNGVLLSSYAEGLSDMENVFRGNATRSIVAVTVTTGLAAEYSDLTWTFTGMSQR